MLRAVLSYPMHPEHGVVTAPFPLPEEDYVSYRGILTTEELMQLKSAEPCPQEPGMQMQ